MACSMRSRMAASPGNGQEGTACGASAAASRSSGYGVASILPSPGQVVGDLWLIEYAGLPKDYLSRFLKGVKSTTVEDVHRVAAKLIDEKELTVVVVGEANAVKADLEKIAPVTVITEQSDETKTPAVDQPQPPT